MTPNSNSAEIFVQCTNAHVSSSYMFTRSEVILLTDKHTHRQTNKQTNRRRWKHPTHFATLRSSVKRVIILFQCNHGITYVMYSGAWSVRQHGRLHVERLDITKWHRGEAAVVVCHVVQRLCWSWNDRILTRSWTRCRHVLGRRFRGNLPAFCSAVKS